MGEGTNVQGAAGGPRVGSSCSSTTAAADAHRATGDGCHRLSVADSQDQRWVEEWLDHDIGATSSSDSAPDGQPSALQTSRVAEAQRDQSFERIASSLYSRAPRSALAQRLDGRPADARAGRWRR